MEVVAHQPAISLSISIQHLFSRAGGRTSNVLHKMIGYLSSLVAMIVMLRITKSRALQFGAAMFAYGTVVVIHDVASYPSNQARRLSVIEYNLPKGESINRERALEAIRWVALGDRNLQQTISYPVCALILGGSIFFFVALKKTRPEQVGRGDGDKPSI